MFEGHVANMRRLGPEKKLVATDPVIVNGEMVAAYHKLFASVALMAVNDIHAKIQKPKD